jgi:hypothetical protein
MTKLLEQALEAARSLSPDAQDDIARAVLRLAGTDEEPPVTLPRGTDSYRDLAGGRRPWRICDR